MTAVSAKGERLCLASCTWPHFSPTNTHVRTDVGPGVAGLAQMPIGALFKENHKIMSAKLETKVNTTLQVERITTCYPLFFETDKYHGYFTNPGK